MKKILFSIFMILVLFTGCGKLNDKQIKDKFIDEMESLKSYNLQGTLKLINNDDTYSYDVNVGYKKGDYYKVSLKNKNNNYEQIILRNDEGVYVITPSLNKSFRFQSDWPYNNSQAYILKSIVEDMKNSSNCEYKKDKNNHIFTTEVNYPNNPKLIKQNIILDKDYNLSKIEVLDKNDIVLIEFEVVSFDKKPTFANNYFDVEKQIIEQTEDTNNKANSSEENEEKEESNEANGTKETNETDEAKETNGTNETKDVMSIDDALFPLYIPENTSMTNREVINTDIGERVIMTFSGDKPFILVEENVAREDDLTIIPTYGEPYLLIDTVGSLTDVSYTWTSNGIEYYIVSDVMEQNEILEVASSIGVVSTIAEK